MRRMAASSWSPQSQRSDPKMSPVRHSECTRTSTSAVAGDGAHREHDVLGAVEGRLEDRHLEDAVRRRDRHGRPLDPPHLGLDPAAVAIRSAMEIMSRPCSAANRASSGRPGHAGAPLVDDLADDPDRLQAGEAGEIDGRLRVADPLEDASRRARSGNTCPGRARSSGVVIGSASARIVVHRSNPEMPVVVWWRRSTLTVNAVPIRSVLVATMGGSASSSARAASMGTQMSPRRVLDEERELLGRRLLRRHDEVALVLTVLVVDDHDDLPPADGVDGVVHPIPGGAGGPPAIVGEVLAGGHGSPRVGRGATGPRSSSVVAVTPPDPHFPARSAQLPGDYAAGGRHPGRGSWRNRLATPGTPGRDVDPVHSRRQP